LSVTIVDNALLSIAVENVNAVQSTVDKSIQQLLKAVGSDIKKAVKALKSWKRGGLPQKNAFSMDIFPTRKGLGSTK